MSSKEADHEETSYDPTQRRRSTVAALNNNVKGE